MSFIQHLKRIYDNEIEILELDYETYCKKMLIQELDSENIKSELESIIVEVISDHKLRGNSEVRYVIENIVKSTSTNVNKDNIVDLIIPHKYMPLFSDVIGKNLENEFVENLESLYPFRLLKSKIEIDMNGVEFIYDFKVQFEKENNGTYVISNITWNPTLLFEW